MSQINEALDAGSQLYIALSEGIDAIDGSETVTFQAYTRVVLPVDGYVFWAPTVTLTVGGFLHYSQDVQQNEDETLGYATVVFTSKGQVPEFSASPTNTIYVATCESFRYAFSAQNMHSQVAGIWHYSGHSVEPALQAQLLDDPASIDPTRAVASNSISLWLAFATAKSPLGDGFSCNLPLYPSFLTPPNLVPAYGAVHIGQNDTKALQPVRLLDRNRNHSQLMTDHVRITLYGLQSDEAMDFVDAILSYSELTDNFGMMTMPAITDAKRVQTELLAIAMEKVVEFDVSYYQTRAAQVSRQLILSCLPTFIVGTMVNRVYRLTTQSGFNIGTQGGQDILSQTGPASVGTQGFGSQQTQSNQDIGPQ